MRPCCVVLKRLDQHELVRIIDTPRPVEPQVAGLGSSSQGEVPRQIEPTIDVIRLDLELDRNEDHVDSSRSSRATDGPDRKARTGYSGEPYQIATEHRCW